MAEERKHKPSCKSRIRSVYKLSQPCDCDPMTSDLEKELKGIATCDAHTVCRLETCFYCEQNMKLCRQAAAIAERLAVGRSPLENVAKAIRSCEGHPITYGLGMKMSEVLREVEAELANAIREDKG